MPAPIELIARPSKRARLLSPAQGAALLAAQRAASGLETATARHYWLLASDARRAYAQGRLSAGFGNLTGIRFRLARAVAAGDRAWAARWRAAEADIEARAALAELRLLAALETEDRP